MGVATYKLWGLSYELLSTQLAGIHRVNLTVVEMERAFSQG